MTKVPVLVLSGGGGEEWEVKHFFAGFLEVPKKSPVKVFLPVLPSLLARGSNYGKIECVLNVINRGSRPWVWGVD
jgi:hypothetical protein